MFSKQIFGIFHCAHRSFWAKINSSFFDICVIHNQMKPCCSCCLFICNFRLFAVSVPLKFYELDCVTGTCLILVVLCNRSSDKYERTIEHTIPSIILYYMWFIFILFAYVCYDHFHVTNIHTHTRTHTYAVPSINFIII